MINKELIIIRGLPGSGKTELAKLLVRNGIRLSTDDKFMIGEEYVFDVEKLGHFHYLNFVDAVKAMIDGISPVIIDNTNIKANHCRNYVEVGKMLGYKVSVAEVQTAWKFNVDELVKRNTHGVTRETIEGMLLEYEGSIVFKMNLGIE